MFKGIYLPASLADLKAEMRAETMVDPKANIGEKHREK